LLVIFGREKDVTGRVRGDELVRGEPKDVARKFEGCVLVELPVVRVDAVATSSEMDQDALTRVLVPHGNDDVVIAEAPKLFELGFAVQINEGFAFVVELLERLLGLLFFEEKVCGLLIRDLKEVVGLYEVEQIRFSPPDLP
jgi:hypothetical protein